MVPNKLYFLTYL